MSRTTLISIAVVVLLVLGAFAMFGGLSAPEAKHYASNAHDIEFSYPGDYDLTEQAITVEGVNLAVITLLPSDLEVPENGEGPPTVSVVIGDNSSGTALADWVNQFQSVIGGPSFDFTEGEFAGSPSLSYTSTGLYEADNIAVAHGNKVYIVSGSWMTREDRTLTVFAEVVQSFRFTKEE